MRTIVKAIASVTMSMILNAPADEIERTPMPASTAPDDGAIVKDPPPHAYSRRIYTVDDIGMIIGGASEDGKAKVGRLPIQN